MKTRLFTQISGMSLAVMLTLLVGSAGAESNKLVGTWDAEVTSLDVCPTACRCPPVKVKSLNTFLKEGAMQWTGGAVITSSGQESWGRTGQKKDNTFEASFKFFIADLATGRPQAARR